MSKIQAGQRNDRDGRDHGLLSRVLEMRGGAEDSGYPPGADDAGDPEGDPEGDAIASIAEDQKKKPSLRYSTLTTSL